MGLHYPQPLLPLFSSVPAQGLLLLRAQSTNQRDCNVNHGSLLPNPVVRSCCLGHVVRRDIPSRHVSDLVFEPSTGLGLMNTHLCLCSCSHFLYYCLLAVADRERNNCSKGTGFWVTSSGVGGLGSHCLIRHDMTGRSFHCWPNLRKIVPLYLLPLLCYSLQGTYPSIQMKMSAQGMTQS